MTQIEDGCILAPIEELIAKHSRTAELQACSENRPL